MLLRQAFLNGSDAATTHLKVAAINWGNVGTGAAITGGLGALSGLISPDEGHGRLDTALSRGVMGAIPGAVGGAAAGPAMGLLKQHAPSIHKPIAGAAKSIGQIPGKVQDWMRGGEAGAQGSFVPNKGPRTRATKSQDLDRAARTVSKTRDITPESESMLMSDLAAPGHVMDNAAKIPGMGTDPIAASKYLSALAHG